MLDKEFKYYLDNQNQLVEAYNGKTLVIKDQEVKGAYDNLSKAYHEASEHFELGTFLIQLCTEGDSAYTASYTSRVVF